LPPKTVDCGYKAVGSQGYKLVTPNAKFGETPKRPYCKKHGGNGCGNRLSSYHDQRYVDHGWASCISKVVDTGRVDGCSVPKKVDNMYGHLFNGACEEHDINYHVSSKKTADNNFLGNMKQICEHFYLGSQNSAQKHACYSAAATFYVAVHEKGQEGYDSDHAWRKKHCKIKKIHIPQRFR
jgi:hypothetical protein